MANKFS